MNIDKLVLREEEARDYPKVYNVNTEAFGRSEEAQIVDRLRSGNTFVKELSLVAELDSKIIGHILLTKIKIVNGDIKNDSLALAPMAVLPEYQRLGVGSKLVREGIARAKLLGYKSIVVLGHESFYPQFNFTPANKWNIRAPFNVPISTFMALELEPKALENVEGVVEYSSEFRLDE